MPLTFEEAKEKLSACIRHECRDHAFGDREVSWITADTSESVAEGYGGGTFEIGFDEPHADTFFQGKQAQELMECGIEGVVTRNDSTGPDEYKDGEILPGLTIEGVRKELTGG